MPGLRKRTTAEVAQEKLNRHYAPRPGEEVYKWNYLIYRDGRARYLGSTDRPAEREKEHRAELPPTFEYEFRFYPWRGVDHRLIVGMVNAPETSAERFYRAEWRASRSS